MSPGGGRRERTRRPDAEHGRTPIPPGDARRDREGAAAARISGCRSRPSPRVPAPRSNRGVRCGGRACRVPLGGGRVPFQTVPPISDRRTLSRGFRSFVTPLMHPAQYATHVVGLTASYTGRRTPTTAHARRLERLCWAWP